MHGEEKMIIQGRERNIAGVVTLCRKEGRSLMHEQRVPRQTCSVVLNGRQNSLAQMLVSKVRWWGGVYGYSVSLFWICRNIKAGHQLRMRLRQEVWKVERKKSLNGF